MNPFHEGQTVVCINTNFPEMITTSEDKSRIGKIPPNHPKIGERLCIDEILGEFLRFDKYDIPESFNWWKYTHFAPIDDQGIEESISELLAHPHHNNP